MSYIERTLWWFLKNKIFGGLKKLRQVEYLPFTVMIVSIMSFNTIIAILYQQNFLISLELVQDVLIYELFLSFAVIVSSVLIGKLKSLLGYFLIPLVIIALSIIAFLYIDWSYSHIFFQYVKLIYFFIWVGISIISLFFLTLYFFTSFPKKILTLGIEKDHIFFGSVIKIVLYISLLLYCYLIFQFYPVDLIIGIFGIINTLIVLFLIKRAPKKVDSIPGIINFTTAIGFFNVSMFYHLVMSLPSFTNAASSLVIDILFLLIIVLYVVQKLTIRISDSPSRLMPHENPVKFQSRVYFTDRLKHVIGERGVVLLVMGIALGYHVVIIDSFFITEIPILPSFFSPNLEFSLISHRVYLFFSFILVLIAIITFKLSKRANKFMVEKYTIKQVLKYMGGFFKKTEGGSSVVELGIQSLGKKIDSRIKDLGNKWQKSVKNLQKVNDDNEED
ncbi:MAG: hypothetical protein ACTSRI_08840 [Promethearchaeota archaeon]